MHGSTPISEVGQAGLAAILADPRRALIALDYDGVLAPIVADPANSPPLPGIIAALTRVAEQVGSVAIITGRPAKVVLDYGNLTAEPKLAGLVVFGHYGLQRADAGTGQVVSPPPPAELAAVRRELPDLLARHGAADAWIEDKVVALAVHTRRCADPAAALEALRSPIADCAQRHGLHVEPGRFVLEIRSPGVDKGQTLRSYADERAATSVCYIGDDLGDLPAFAAVESLRRNGIAGMTVASGSTEVTEVADRADLVVEGPPGVLTLLTEMADRLASASTSSDPHASHARTSMDAV